MRLDSRTAAIIGSLSSNRVGDGLFAVDVFARLHGIDQDAHVPVVGRGDDHGVDIFAVEQRAVVSVFLGVRRMRGFGGDQVRFVDIAHAPQYRSTRPD